MWLGGGGGKGGERRVRLPYQIMSAMCAIWTYIVEMRICFMRCRKLKFRIIRVYRAIARDRVEERSERAGRTALYLFKKKYIDEIYMCIGVYVCINFICALYTRSKRAPAILRLYLLLFANLARQRFV